MSAQDEIPERFPIRYTKDEGWQALVVEGESSFWVVCETQDEAEAIADGTALVLEAHAGATTSEDMLERLELSAAAYRMYLPSMPATRILSRKARKAREQATAGHNDGE